MNKLTSMSIHEIVDFAKNHVEEFNAEAQLFQQENIVAMCETQDNPSQCEWRLNGLLFKLNQDASKYKDPIARLNFVIARFYSFIKVNYRSKDNAR